MSVLIKGMDMPKDCGDCPFCIFTANEKKCIGYCNTSDDDYYCKALDRFMEYDKIDGGIDILGKPEDCPLIEIPTPHGRLIDANELFNSIAEKERLLSFDHSGLYVDISDMNDVFKHIETVVGAEDE